METPGFRRNLSNSAEKQFHAFLKRDYRHFNLCLANVRRELGATRGAMASHRSLSVALCQSESEICWIPRWKPSPRVPSYVAFATHTDFVDELSSIAFVFHSILSWQPQSMLWEACQHVTKAFEHSSSRELWSSCAKQPSMETSKRISTLSKCMKYSFYFAKNNGMEIQLLISWREDRDWLTLEDQETGCSSELTRLICFQYWKKRKKKVQLKLIYLFDLTTKTGAKSPLFADGSITEAYSSTI